jgi:nitrogen-specific signal transduction histidine kinase
MLILFTTKQDKAHASEAASQFEIKRKALISLKKREEEITEIVEKDKKLKRYSYNLLKRLKEYEQSTHTNITDVVPTPFILLDENAAIVTINKSALNFFGYPDDKSHKPSLNQLFKIGSLTSILWINKVIASNIPSLDIEVVLSDKTSKWSRVQIQKLDDKEYKYAINVVDISDLKTNSDALTLSLDRAKIAETELKLFADIQLETNEQLLIAENQLRTLLEKEQESKAVLNQAINALKDTQGQLVHSEKMASLGQLTAGIAHEINNPINFIYNGINLSL